jgi:hypothetical protein
MLLNVLSDASQSRSPLGYPEAFSTTYLIVLTLLYHTTSTLNRHHRIEAPFIVVFYLYSAQYTTMPTIRDPDPALSIGFEIVSLPDQAVQISSSTSVPQQQ